MSNKIRIAILEDEIFIAENLRYTLEDLGYEVAFVANTYEEAVEEIERKIDEFDLMLLDIYLKNSDKTGFEVAQFLSKYSYKPFIFLTAFSDKKTVNTAVSYKPTAYLVKPVSEGALFAAIQTAIENFTTQTAAKLPNEEEEQIDHFFTKVGNKIIKVAWAEVYCLSASKNYVNFITSPHTSGYPIRSSLQQAISRIVPSHIQQMYIPINRAMFIRKEIIEGAGEKSIFTTYGEFELGASFVAGVKQFLNIL